MPTAALLRSLQWVSYRRVPPGHCAAPHDAVQHIHVIVHLTHDTAIPHTPQVPHSGTDYQKPTASCEAAPLWGIATLPSPHRFRVAGPTIRNPLQAAKQRRCGYKPSSHIPHRFRDAGPTIRNPLQAAKQRSCGYKQTSHLSTGSATRDRLSETHCKLRSSAAVGITNLPSPHRFRVAGL